MPPPPQFERFSEEETFNNENRIEVGTLVELRLKEAQDGAAGGADATVRGVARWTGWMPADDCRGVGIELVRNERRLVAKQRILAFYQLQKKHL